MFPDLIDANYVRSASLIFPPLFSTYNRTFHATFAFIFVICALYFKFNYYSKELESSLFLFRIYSFHNITEKVIGEKFSFCGFAKKPRWNSSPTTAYCKSSTNEMQSSALTSILKYPSFNFPAGEDRLDSLYKNIRLVRERYLEERFHVFRPQTSAAV
jgi:hypothetical protein